ncbi:MAG: 2-succinyl-6-hydroxy-2,4-cyclohexadiene-1-carboxylate synthase [Dehalococcoidia bacterium]|nr:2-succinyl-6-hydroxy-2,4-cyclohexadiene-1-carboxylate synthase [Dehalococcoidia bacterium]
MTRVDLPGGFALNVEVAGDGPPLVLLHGFTGSARSWGRFGELFAERFTTVAVDLVGHGQSDAPADLEHYAMERCVEDTVTAVAKLGFERAPWLGYSMGGRTALQVANAEPGAVSALVLIGASAGLDCVEDRLARRSADGALATRIERDGVEAFVDYWENIPLFATQQALPGDVRQRVREGRLGNHTVGLANSLRGMGTGAQEPLHERLAEIAIPVLVLAGELDVKYVEIGEQLAAMLPRARFEAIPGAGHAAQLERPDDTAAAVLRFFDTTTT